MQPFFFWEEHEEKRGPYARRCTHTRMYVCLLMFVQAVSYVCVCFVYVCLCLSVHDMSRYACTKCTYTGNVYPKAGGDDARRHRRRGPLQCAVSDPVLRGTWACRNACHTRFLLGWGCGKIEVGEIGAREAITQPKNFDLLLCPFCADKKDELGNEVGNEKDRKSLVGL